MIKLDRKVPLPPRMGTIQNGYPWKEMKIGDSFYVADRGLRGSFYSVAARHGYKIAVRNDGEGVRVWRTA